MDPNTILAFLSGAGVMAGFVGVDKWFTARTKLARRVAILEDHHEWVKGRLKWADEYTGLVYDKMTEAFDRLFLANYYLTQGKDTMARDVVLRRTSYEAVREEIRAMRDAMIEGGVLPSGWRLDGENYPKPPSRQE